MATIEEAAERLSDIGVRKDKLEEKFSDIDYIETDSTVKEGFLKKEIEKKRTETVAGIDGGLVKKRYSAGDVVATRAVAAIFNFSNDLDVDYFPSKSPEPEFQVFPAHDSDSMDRNAETERVKAEISVAERVIDEAEQVLMDGSIVPSYLEDNKALEIYNRVFEKAAKGQLAGLVEDSYGLKLAKVLEEKLDVELGRMRDTLVMDAILGEGERSFVRRYSDSPVEHPVLQELEDRYVNNIHTFYVKLSSQDIPLRIDYFGDVDDADVISEILQQLMSSERYTVPSPIVEADKRAKISESYVKRLEKRFSPGLKRRERRLF